MDIDEFKAIDSAARRRNDKAFRLSVPDLRASKSELIEVESKLGIRLPNDYKDFLKEFGGGSFGLATIFSADSASEWYLPSKQSEASSYLPSGLVAFSDDFSGGLYVLQVVDNVAQSSVLYWNADGGLVRTEFSDVLEFVTRYAYGNAAD